eukprot:scaffold45440_cov23-Tisochrysis_lutea.AAC.4
MERALERKGQHRGVAHRQAAGEAGSRNHLPEPEGRVQDAISRVLAALCCFGRCFMTCVGAALACRGLQPWHGTDLVLHDLRWHCPDSKKPWPGTKLVWGIADYCFQSASWPASALLRPAAMARYKSGSDYGKGESQSCLC